MKKTKYPITHLSFSAIRQYLSDRNMFNKRYIRHEYDDFTVPAIIEGSLFHEVLASYYTDPKDFDYNLQLGVAVGFNESMGKYDKVDWGKTGSLDKSTKTVLQALDFYFKEKPDYKVDCVEQKFITNFYDLDGKLKPIPIKGVVDLIINTDDGYEVIDHKLVSTLCQPDEINPGFELQACTYWFMLQNYKGEPPKRIIFDQVKKSRNSDNSPQIVRFVVEPSEDMLKRFLFIYDTILEEIGHKKNKYLPNVFDMLSGEESWIDFINQTKDE